MKKSFDTMTDVELGAQLRQDLGVGVGISSALAAAIVEDPVLERRLLAIVRDLPKGPLVVIKKAS